MTSNQNLADELIQDRQVEEFREIIKDDIRSHASQARVRQVAARIYIRLADSWGLSERQSAALLSTSVRNIRSWRAEDPPRLDADELEKISCLLNIYIGLFTLYSGHADRVERWLRRENYGSLYDGSTPYKVLKGASANVFHKVRRDVAGAAL